MEGFVAANVLGLFLGIADRAIRGILKRRREALVRTMPLHKRRQKEEWEQIAHSGLTGKVKEDQSIRTVGDLWRRLSGNEDEKKRKR